ncbi:MAG: primase [Patescibacteria group bacterium]|jgi:DNA primase|nr:primase [Patescibacteria group bacterium]
MTSPVDLIKERLNIVDVVSAYVALVPAGKNYKGKSPFKQERTPSFYVSPDKGLYHCFSTGKGGDMFTFVQEMEGLDFRGALKVLADKAGISLQNFNPKEKEEKDKLYEIMEEATKFFQLKLKESKEVTDYLVLNRGLIEKSIEEFRVGYAPAGWRNLYDYLKNKFQEKDLSLVGLIKKTERGHYDTFRDRIMFPICDSSGRTIAFSGRIFKDDGKSAKYVNSPDTPLFNKSDVLFGIDKAKNYIRKYNFTTIVEGQFDVALLHQAGFKNTVGVSGTALSDTTTGKNSSVNNLGVIKRLSNNLVLAFDSDSAGVNAAKRSASIAMSLGMDVKIVDVLGGKDPADIIKDFGKDAWSKILKNAKHLILFYTHKIKNSAKDERDLGKRIKEEVLPEIVKINSDIERAYFIKEVSSITGIKEDYIISDLSKATTANFVPKKEALPKKEFQNIEEKVSDIEKEIWGAYIAKDKDDKIKEKIVEVSGEGGFQILLDKFKDRESEFVFSERDYTLGLEETFDNYKRNYLQKKLLDIKEELRFADSERDDERANKLLKEQQLLQKEIDQINNSRYIKSN